MQRWPYRSRQFFTALLGNVSSAEMAGAWRVLGPDLYMLFAALPLPYRRHALTVCRRVVEAGCDDPYVQQAALLHDAGKLDYDSGRYVTTFHRVIVVLLEAVPGGGALLRWLSERGRARGRLLYPFYLSCQHAALGARLAARYGAAEEVVALIAGHHTYSGQSKQMLALQAADDRS